MPCPPKDGLIENTSAAEITGCSFVSGFLQCLFVDCWLDTDLEDQRKLIFLDCPCLHPGVCQSREKEVSEVESQLDDNSENAQNVDEKPDVWRTIWLPSVTTHSERLYKNRPDGLVENK